MRKYERGKVKKKETNWCEKDKVKIIIKTQQEKNRIRKEQNYEELNLSDFKF